MADSSSELEELRAENARLREELKACSAGGSPSAISSFGDVDEDGGGGACPAPTWAAGAGHSLRRDQIQRYSRQLLLPSFGVAAQEKLCKGSVLIVGAGGLGSPVALYLAACGVGCLGIMDPDRVELHNLHRQVIHNEAHTGALKVASASRACLAINSSIKVRTFLRNTSQSNS
jgi:adenylyltransferase/sulfurtransferase